MIAAIADKKVQRSQLKWKPLSNDRSDRSVRSVRSIAIIWKPALSLDRTDPGFPKFKFNLNFFRVIELNNEYETTEIKFKPRTNLSREIGDESPRITESEFETQVSFLLLRSFVFSSLPSLIPKAFLPSALRNQTSHFCLDLNGHLVNDFLSSSINKLH